MTLEPISFDEALGLVVNLEGRYANDPSDPGGETKWGIARKRHPEISEADWAKFSPGDARNLYKTSYFDAHRCGEMPRGWGLAIFDGEVVQGEVIKLAQAAIGAVPDGQVGPQTLVRFQLATHEDFCLFMALRGVKYTHSPLFPRDGKGWLKRLFLISAFALESPHDGPTSAGA